MKNFVKITVAIIVLVSVVVSGCKKMEISENENSQIFNIQESQVINNSVFDYSILKYKSKSSFLKGLDNDKKSLDDFYSLYDYYFDAQQIFDSMGVIGLNENNFDLSYFDYDTSGIFELNIDDEELAKLLSPQGYIQIGDTIMKVNAENVIFISNSDYSLVESVNNSDFRNENVIVNNSKSFPIVKTEKYYDNGWNEGCHRIYLKRWYRNYELYVRAGVTISYYTRIYKREWLFGPKRLVWKKEDKADLYIKGSCDSSSIIVILDDELYSNTYNTKILFEKSKYCNHIAMSKNPTNISFFFWEYNSFIVYNIYNFRLKYNTPIKNGTI